MKSEHWKNCSAHAAEMKNAHIRDVVDTKKESEGIATTQNITINFRKQLLDANSWNSLFALAESKQLKSKIDALLSGEVVNPTEGRAALHTALREPKGSTLAGKETNDSVHIELEKLAKVVTDLRSGNLKGSTDKAFTDIVYLGVGGSNLGPEFILSALHEFDQVTSNTPTVHFVSCMDGVQLMRVLTTLNAETTLMVICSKSFGTKDTLLNAETLLSWFADNFGDKQIGLDKHCIGISSNPERMTQFGIPKDKQLLLWDWVGGRYSLWSAVGLPIALRLGMQGFNDLLAGAHAMDQHFLEVEPTKNLPIIMGLISFWNTTMLGMGRNMVLPYDARLGMLAQYLAQLHMESLGKHTTIGLKPVSYATGSMLWGDIGSNAQHSFYQLLHQGTESFFTDFILCKHEPNYADYPDNVKAEFRKQFRYAHANCLAQSDLMAFGQESDDPNKRYVGNKPSVTILLDKLDPFVLGQLVALYEHRTYVNSVLLDINAFDQYGVEQGKVMAEDYAQKLSSDTDYFGVLQELM